MSKARRLHRGSEWRKWDLHVHPPGTHLADNYKGGNEDETWERYCDWLESAEVAVWGITDYFSLEGYFKTRERFEAKYPQSDKVLVPNIELRLNESVNDQQQEVHIHLLLQPGITRKTGNRLLSELKTAVDVPGSGAALSCADLDSEQIRQGATVSRDAISDALHETFGDTLPRQEHALIVVAANNSGIRASDGAKRKAKIADAIDRLADAAFGNAENTGHYLNRDRSRDDEPIPAKPVFGGSDAHSFKALEAGGQTATGKPSAVTWIKADPTYQGLLQTLVEPDERVHLGAARPDRKEPFKVISAVHFSGSADFPKTQVFNQNLVSIIGSRSSGKSALLAYIAHTVDENYAISQQLAANPGGERASMGPAPGKTWDEVRRIKCEVEWGGDGEIDGGKVIYIPQNSLFWISEQPEEITAKIEPTLHRLDSAFARAHRQMRSELEAWREEIRDGAEDWFQETRTLEAAEEARADFGRASSIRKARTRLEKEIEKKRKGSALSEKESNEYEDLIDKLGEIQARRREIETETSQLASYLRTGKSGHQAAASVDATLRLTPSPSEVPMSLRQELERVIESGEEDARKRLSKALIEHQGALDKEIAKLNSDEERLRKRHAKLMKKNEADEEVEALVSDKKKQDEALAELTQKSKEIEVLAKGRAKAIARVESAIARREEAIAELVKAFESKERVLEGEMRFGVETGWNESVRRGVSERVNRKERSEFVEREQGLKLEKCAREPGKFLVAIHDGKQKVIKDQDPEEVAIDALLASREVRFSAEIEDDKIGGFEASTMTPGKQALFALALILNESEEAWPLLIDQPEDDLDSRSIYDVLVRYLSERKKDRQIVMVTHNANLAIGADSEQVIVANRHGDEGRENRHGRLFAYMSGSLEHSQEASESKYAFDACGGIREHACEILDGGEEAFRKRQEKYKIT